MKEQWLKDLSRDTALRVCGRHDRHLRLLREALGVQITARDGTIRVSGEDAAVAEAIGILEALLAAVRCGDVIPQDFVEQALHATLGARPTPGSTSWSRSEGQRRYVDAMQSNDIVCCVGPAGTGKTYLAVKMAVSCLREGRIKRLVLCRPAVEAGEKLGYLPGDFFAKVHPYLRPLYDALNDILDYDHVKRYMERELMEVIPLAYMRGRTLSQAFIILDEGQNTTTAQMKMFLTRMGEGSRVVVTGDITQIDLEQGRSGLIEAREILGDVPGIAWVTLDRHDIVRHPLVGCIVEAYERAAQARRREGSA